MKLTTLLFDLDRTLVDIRQSYEQAIRLATVEYLRRRGGERLVPQQVCSDDDLYQLWWRSELADVWYLTYAWSQYYVVSEASRPTKPEFIKRLLTVPGKKWTEIIPAALGQEPEQGWSQTEAQTLFQNFFCGSDWIQREQVYPWLLAETRDGTYVHDQLIGGVRTLQALERAQKRFNLGIATARPRDEALQCIRQLGLTEFFPADCIGTLELGSKAGRIRHVLQQLPPSEGIAYCGDTTADLKAVAEVRAQGIPIIGVGVNVFSPRYDLMERQQQLLMKAGASVVLNDVTEYAAANWLENDQTIK